MKGLSPYTRGNQRAISPYVFRMGSIPVHTGKPLRLDPYTVKVTVYPRTHGETCLDFALGQGGKGLSPYTRGNRFKAARPPVSLRSIPVHTGKPINASGFSFARRVYPRTHGETESNVRSPKGESGLSPYTRGNRKARCTS